MPAATAGMPLLIRSFFSSSVSSLDGSSVVSVFGCSSVVVSSVGELARICLVAILTISEVRDSRCVGGRMSVESLKPNALKMRIIFSPESSVVFVCLFNLHFSVVFQVEALCEYSNICSVICAKLNSSLVL